MPVHYPLAVIADVATDVCSSRARLRFVSSTRIVVMCRMIAMAFGTRRLLFPSTRTAPKFGPATVGNVAGPPLALC